MTYKNMIVIDRDATPGPDRCSSCLSQRFIAPPHASMEGVAEISRENKMIFLPGCRAVLCRRWFVARAPRRSLFSETMDYGCVIASPAANLGHFTPRDRGCVRSPVEAA
jgi:hypothetical protein